MWRPTSNIFPVCCPSTSLFTVNIDREEDKGKLKESAGKGLLFIIFEIIKQNAKSSFSEVKLS